MTSDSPCFCLRMSWIVVRNMVNRLYNSVLSAVSSTVSDCLRCIVTTDKPRESLSMDNVADLFHLYEPVFNDIEIPMENEPYFRAVDRLTAEEILQNRIDGSCLVRPFKESNETIKFIVSIYAKEHFFHLFIRRCDDGVYAIGQEKPNEKLFNKPVDAINFYRLNKLLCTNREVSSSFFLVPISK